MRNSEEDKRHIAHLEDDFMYMYYGLKEIIRVAQEVLGKADTLRKFIEGEGNGNDSDNKTD